MNCLVPKSRSYQRYFAALAAAFALVVAPTAAVAQTNFFVPPPGDVGLSGDWSDTANWTLGHLPTTGETATIHRGREATIDIVNPDQFNIIRIADNDFAAVDGTLNILPGAGLDVLDRILFSAGGPAAHHGEINQSGGTLSVGEVIFIAFGPTHSADYNLSDGTINTKNLWFRFGDGTMTQSGGEVNASGDLILAEGGGPLSSALYDMQGGTLNVTGEANIGKAPGGPGDPFGGSFGVMNLSGGIATFGDLLFGLDTVDLSNVPTDVINLSGSGILRVNQANYSEADALADIAAGKILGSNLVVSTFNGAAPLTQISVVPEPTSIALALFSSVAATFVRRRRA